jgi:hypothetical protein
MARADAVDSAVTPAQARLTAIGTAHAWEPTALMAALTTRSGQF